MRSPVVDPSSPAVDLDGLDMPWLSIDVGVDTIVLDVRMS